jgi:hypothetical protein
VSCAPQKKSEQIRHLVVNRRGSEMASMSC